jgi:hypothetical protein
MPRIEQQYLIASCGLDPVRINLIRHFYTQFDYRTTAGINRRIVNVEPLCYEGATAASEFLVYAATKLYICFEYAFANAIAQVAIPYIYFYDEGNVAVFFYVFHMPYWDTTAVAPRYLCQSPVQYNIWFSRLAAGGYSYMKFNGYRITLD